MTAEERLREVEALAMRAREEGSDLNPWTVILICEDRWHPPARVRPLTHDRPDQVEQGTGG